MSSEFEKVFEHKAKVEPGDYTGEDGLLYCGKCRTRKEYRYFHSLFNRDWVSPVACDCASAAFEKAEEERRQYERMERAERLRGAGVGDESYRKMTFAADDGGGDREAAGVACRYVQHWQAMKDGNVGLVFSGEPGNGKTFFASCIANALIDQGIPAMITTIPALIAAMAADFEAQKPEILRQIQDVDLLVLDDVGVERKTGYTAEKLFEIVDARYRSGKPLIVTTNLSLGEIQNPSTLEYKRVFDRILELCQPVPVRGRSRRGEIAKCKADYARALLRGDAR